MLLGSQRFSQYLQLQNGSPTPVQYNTLTKSAHNIHCQAKIKLVNKYTFHRCDLEVDYKQFRIISLLKISRNTDASIWAKAQEIICTLVLTVITSGLH